MNIIDKFPAIYAELLPDFFHSAIHEESMATCDDCYMCPKPGQPLDPTRKYFSPELKCCTYYPKIPNYLVGAILSDDNPVFDEGRRKILDRISNYIAVTPQGLLRPLEFSDGQQDDEHGFGLDKKLLCPYFNSRNKKCSIWMIVPPICATWFCVHMGHGYGKEFWKAIRIYLHHVEQELTYYALQQLYFAPLNIFEYSFDTFDYDPIPQPFLNNDKTEANDEYSTLWEAWAGREKELYIETFHIINKLTKNEFEHICGIKQSILMQNIQDKYEVVISPEYQRILKYHAMSLDK